LSGCDGGGRRRLLIGGPRGGAGQPEVLELLRADGRGRRRVGRGRGLGRVLGERPRRHEPQPARQQYRPQAQIRPHRSAFVAWIAAPSPGGEHGPMPAPRRLFKHIADERCRNPTQVSRYRASTSTSSLSSSAAISIRLSPVIAMPSRAPAKTPFTRTFPLGTR